MAEKIKLTFLGTGSAVPTKKKNHSATLIQYKDESILIDCGEGTQRQFRYADISPAKLTKILITHWHGDHVLGLPGLLQTLMLNNFSKNLEIYGPEGTQRMLETMMSLFVGKGDQLKIRVYEIEPGIIIDNDEFFIQAEQMDHDAPTLAYSFNIKEKSRLDKQKLKKLKIPNSPLLGELAKGKTIEINGKKIDPKKLIYKEEAKKITIIPDTRLNNNCYKIAENSDILISESTYDKEGEELAKEYFHLTSEQAAEIAKKSKSKKLFLVHLSQKHEKDASNLLKEAKKIFKNTILAEDLMNLEL